jgi:ABC-2 type transport system ATP-binding protein
LQTTAFPEIEEIKSFLNYHDYSLAVRRLLDICLDSGKGVLLKEAIHLSREFHQHKDVNAGDPLPGIHAMAIALVEKIYDDGITFHPQQKLLLRANDIRKTYRNSRFSLKPLSLDINTSDVLGVVGQNGHGKTTLLRCLAGQLALDDGWIEYTQLKNPDHYAIKHHIAFIPQRIPRWYGQLKDNLHFSASIAGITGDENRLMVDFMLERLDLAQYAHLNWTEISSGYRTRFEIARVLLQRPSLLILDEPLANLDINAQQTILTDLRYMAKSIYQPMGVILSSQQLHEVEKTADTVLFIKNGECLFRTGDEQKGEKEYAIEIETLHEREKLLEILGDGVSIQYNGGFFTIVSTRSPATEMIRTLVSKGVEVTYFRDITHSTKRFF